MTVFCILRQHDRNSSEVSLLADEAAIEQSVPKEEGKRGGRRKAGRRLNSKRNISRGVYVWGNTVRQLTGH